ncbi:MAG: hypothetical protein FJX80_09990 [Bacteroidetes bacterium]|nr:hypothetical protein [Bacteroidota bacterium]
MRWSLFLIVLFLTSLSFGQKTVKYSLYGEARALMCPFLSPKLMDVLTKKGAEGIFKDESLLVHFTTSKEKELSDEMIFKVIDEIGYEPKNFKITRTYE